jgi:hypothetical protein
MLVTVPAPMLFTAAILSRDSPLIHCWITFLLMLSSKGAGIHVILYYNNVINESSNVRQMSRQIGCQMEYGMELYKRGIYSIPQMTEYLAGNNSQ